MKRIISMAMVLAMFTGLFAGCNSDAASSTSASTSDSQSANSDVSTSDTTDPTADIDFSVGLTEGGFFEGVKALDYVTLPDDYNKISLPEDVTTVSDDMVQSQLDTIMSDYASPEQITNRAIVDGDNVNIDYVGSIGGEEFDGGNTGGAGTSVLAGSTGYIDDFLTQIIGHKAGETFDVTVTFPDPYTNNTDLSGKEAVFKTTVNYIEGESIVPELNDAFVKENLSAIYGWATVQDMRDNITESFKTQQIDNYVWQHVVENSTYSELPESVMEFVKSYIGNSVTMQAAQYGFSVEQYLSLTGSEATTLEEYLEVNQESVELNAQQSLVTQAIAEKAEISVSDDDIKAMLGDIDDFSEYETTFGKPYLAMATLSYLVDTFLVDNTVAA